MGVILLEPHIFSFKAPSPKQIKPPEKKSGANVNSHQTFPSGIKVVYDVQAEGLRFLVVWEVVRSCKIVITILFCEHSPVTIP